MASTPLTFGASEVGAGDVGPAHVRSVRCFSATLFITATIREKQQSVPSAVRGSEQARGLFSGRSQNQRLI